MEVKPAFDPLSSAPTASPAPGEQVMKMIQGYWVSQICGTTARLGLPDHLLAGPHSLSELAALTATDREGLARLLRAAATVGLFTELEDEWFELTVLGAQLSLGNGTGSL